VYHRFSKEKKCEVTWLERAVISGIRILLLLPAKISRESILNGSLIATLIHEHTIWARSNYFSPIVAGRPHCGIKKLQDKYSLDLKKRQEGIVLPFSGYFQALLTKTSFKK
jgi:hypothetical protein